MDKEIEAMFWEQQTQSINPGGTKPTTLPTGSLLLGNRPAKIKLYHAEVCCFVLFAPMLV